MVPSDTCTGAVQSDHRTDIMTDSRARMTEFFPPKICHSRARFCHMRARANDRLLRAYDRLLHAYDRLLRAYDRLDIKNSVICAYDSLLKF